MVSPSYFFSSFLKRVITDITGEYNKAILAFEKE
jgi:hypothetical protein